MTTRAASSLTKLYRMRKTLALQASPLCLIFANMLESTRA